jgi:hypothetical protein
MHKIYCTYISLVLAIPLHLYVSAWWWSVCTLGLGSHHFTCTWIHDDDLYTPFTQAVSTFTHTSLHNDNLYISLALMTPLHLYMNLWWWSVYTLRLGSYHWIHTSLHDDDDLYLPLALMIPLHLYMTLWWWSVYILHLYSYNFTRTSLHDNNLYTPLALTTPPHLYMTPWWWSIYTLHLGSYHLIHISLRDDDLYIPFALAIHLDPYVSLGWWSVYTLGLGHTCLWDDYLYIPLAVCLDPYVSPWWWSAVTKRFSICIKLYLKLMCVLWWYFINMLYLRYSTHISCVLRSYCTSITNYIQDCFHASEETEHNTI